jgi:hypothetical protein
MTADPFEVLGLARTATASEISEARRRLAKELHPDLGGSESAMQAVNRAHDEALQMVGEGAVPAVEEVPVPQPPRRPNRHVLHDWPSFTLDVLPPEAFEYVLLAGSILGQLMVDEPPYVLEVLFNDPVQCWCRLDLLPDAGSTTVSLTVAGIDDEPAPDPELIRDLWVAALNEL